MRLISHRGNLTGKYPLMENTPAYIREAVDAGYEVEIDVWGDTKGDYIWDMTALYKKWIWIGYVMALTLYTQKMIRLLSLTVL